MRCTCQWSNFETSEEFSNKMEHKEWRTTYSWLSECISWHPIELKNTHGKKESGHAVRVEQWKSRKQPNLFQNLGKMTSGMWIKQTSFIVPRRSVLRAIHTNTLMFRKCIMLFKHVTNLQKEAVSYWKKTLTLNAWRGLEWTVYQFCTIPIAMCGRLLKFLRNG